MIPCLQGVYSLGDHNSLLNLYSGFEVPENFEFYPSKNILPADPQGSPLSK